MMEGFIAPTATVELRWALANQKYDFSAHQAEEKFDFFNAFSTDRGQKGGDFFVPMYVQDYKWPQFLGPLSVGNSSLEVVFDTGSDWLVVPSSDCRTCTGGSYETEGKPKVRYQKNSLTYGSSIALEGYTYKDKVCLETKPPSCANNFEFLAFDSVKGKLEFAYGVLGLARNEPFLLSGEEVEVGPLFLPTLKQQGDAHREEFSVAMYGAGFSSYIDFSQMVDSRVCGFLGCSLPNATSIKMNEDFYWSSTLQAVAFTSTDNSFRVEDFYAIFDTGSSHLIAPGKYYRAILNKLWVDSDRPAYSEKEGITFVDCYMQGVWENLYLQVDGKWLEVSPYDYIWDVYQDGRTCILMIEEHEYDFFIFGLPIFQGYYMRHLPEESSIEMWPLDQMGKSEIQETPLPKRKLFPKEEEGKCGFGCFLWKLITLPFKIVWWLIKATTWVLLLPFVILLWVLRKCGQIFNKPDPVRPPPSQQMHVALGEKLNVLN